MIEKREDAYMHASRKEERMMRIHYAYNTYIYQLRTVYNKTLSDWVHAPQVWLKDIKLLEMPLLTTNDLHAISRAEVAVNFVQDVE